MLGVNAIPFDHGKRKVRVAVKHFRKHCPIVNRFHGVDKSSFFVVQLQLQSFVIFIEIRVVKAKFFFRD